jgi:hypothetical protein
MQDGLGPSMIPSLPSLSDTYARVRNWRTPAKITIQINFSTVSGNWQLEVSPTDTIADVKQKIFEQHKIAAVQQNLFQQDGSDIALDDTQTILHYKIKDRDILYLKLKNMSYPEKIYVEYETGDPVEVGVFPDKSLDQVRIRIFDQDVVLVDQNDKEYDYTKSLTANNKDKQTIYAQKSTANVDVQIRVNEPNADQGRSSPNPPSGRSRPKTPPHTKTFRRRSHTRRAEHDSEIESDHALSGDENEKLRVAHVQLKICK